MSKKNRSVPQSARPAMNFVRLDEARDRLCFGPVPVDRRSFVKSLLACTNGERREVADVILLEKFGEA